MLRVKGIPVTVQTQKYFYFQVVQVFDQCIHPDFHLKHIKIIIIY